MIESQTGCDEDGERAVSGAQSDGAEVKYARGLEGRWNATLQSWRAKSVACENNQSFFLPICQVSGARLALPCLALTRRLCWCWCMSIHLYVSVSVSVYLCPGAVFFFRVTKKAMERL